MASFGEPEAWADTEFAVYARRAPALGGTIEPLVLRPGRKGDREQVLAAERETLLKRCGDRLGTLVVLAEEGQQMTTRGLADWIGKHGGSRMTFVIGSAYGIHPDLKSEAKLVLSLSKLTFTHEHARLLLAEQLYRVLAVLRGHPYHHD